ncbi:hypothetical protein OIV83_004120 [Microbotryomycetes sp. JL201]|nr:hypothetical protein OIV83_004120 [Microbotryomycetes sp. JL201]
MRDELLLLVFVHGFKGGADTFGAFPERVGHILSQSQPAVDVQPIVYPPFDTRGELVAAVDNHVSWLTTTIAERKAAFEEKGGKGSTRVILLGHSMGGLVIGDTLLSTMGAGSLPILGLIAYDSPLLGLHPGMFKASYGLFRNATGGKPSDPPAKPVQSDKAAKGKGKDTAVAPPAPDADGSNRTKSSWLSFKAVGLGAAAVGALGAAGAAYLHRDAIGSSLSWATSHLSFVGELWKTAELERRVQRITAATHEGVGFHWCVSFPRSSTSDPGAESRFCLSFYTLLPPTANAGARTFCVLPTTPDVSALWSPNTNTRADTEITAHIEMFTEKSDGLYSLAQESSALMSLWLDEARAGRMSGAEGIQEKMV